MLPQRFPLPVAPLFGGIQLRVELAGASRTYAVAEGGFRVLGDVTFRYDEKVKVLRSLSKFILPPLIHTFASGSTPPHLGARHKGEKCRLKYVIYIFRTRVDFDAL